MVKKSEKIKFIQTRWSTNKLALQTIRKQVFINEQKVPEALEWDDYDEICVHFLAVTSTKRPIACARLMPNGKLGRFAIIASWRHKNIGRILLNFVMEYAKRKYIKTMFLDAQTQTIGFYEKCGFEAYGNQFIDAGIPHRRMKQDLGILQLRKDERTYTPDTQALFKLMADNMIMQAQRYVYILTPNLEYPMFNTLSVIKAFFDLAKSSQHTHVHILITKYDDSVKKNAALIELAEKYSTFIKIRETTDFQDRAALMVADYDGYIFRKDHNYYEGEACFTNTSRTKRYTNLFKDLWEHSREIKELKKLRL